MEKTEIKKILKFYKNLNPATQLNINDREVIEVWCDVFKDYSYDQVKKAIVTFSKIKPFAPSIGEIISNIEVPDYTVTKIEPCTIIVQFEDETYGNFPFRFLTSNEAREYSQKFRECNYDKESIRMLHEEHVRKRNSGVLTYRGEAKARLEMKLQNQNKGNRRYDKQNSYGW